MINQWTEQDDVCQGLLILIASFAGYAVRRHRDDPGFSLQHEVQAAFRTNALSFDGSSIMGKWPQSGRGPLPRLPLHPKEGHGAFMDIPAYYRAVSFPRLMT